MFADAVTSYADDRRLSVEHDGFAESTQMKRDFEDVNEFKDLPRTECARKRCRWIDAHRRRQTLGVAPTPRSRGDDTTQRLSAASVANCVERRKESSA